MEGDKAWRAHLHGGEDDGGVEAAAHGVDGDECDAVGEHGRANCSRMQGFLLRSWKI